MSATSVLPAFLYTVKIASCASIALLVGAVVRAEGLVDFTVINLWQTKHADDFRFCTGSDPSIPGYIAIHSRNEWKEHCGGRHGEAVAIIGPNIDFHRYTLLVANAGVKPSSGYSLVFRLVRETSAAVSVDIVELKPGPSCPVLTEIVPSLQAYALIPETSKPIRFSVSRALVDCNFRSTVQ